MAWRPESLVRDGAQLGFKLGLSNVRKNQHQTRRLMQNDRPPWAAEASWQQNCSLRNNIQTPGVLKMQNMAVARCSRDNPSSS